MHCAGSMLLGSLFLLAVGVALGCEPIKPGCVCKTPPLSAATYADITRTLTTAIKASLERRVEAIAKGDTVGVIVRLAFHDAGEFGADGLRADGCINFALPDNNGLQDAVSFLDPLWARHCADISRADFWYLASKLSVELTSKKTPVRLRFRYGREDRASCAYTDGRLPSPQRGLDGIREYFVDNLGLTLDDAVALLGAHTLGRAERRFSGFNGAWVAKTAEFDNRYYDDMLNIAWTKTARVTASGDTLNTWVISNNKNNDSRIMLNSDMCLGFEGVETAPTNAVCGGGSSSAERQCGAAATRALAEKFARDNDAFVNAYAAAFDRLMAVGYADSDLREDAMLVAVEASASDAKVGTAGGSSASGTVGATVGAVAAVGLVLVGVVVVVAVRRRRFAQRATTEEPVIPAIAHISSDI